MTEEQNVPSVAEPAPNEAPNEEYWGQDSNAEAPVPHAQPETTLEPFEDAQAPVQQAEQPENINDEQKRYQYWQSRYDQKASEFDNMSKKIAEYEKIAPIAEYIQDNPAVLNNVAKSLSGDNPGVPSQEKSMELPQKPTRPTKPTNYDATEAYMDPESTSYKYRVDLDNYRDGMIDYAEQREAYAIRENEKREAVWQQRQQQAQRNQAMDGMRNQLINQYGYTPEKAVEFIKHYSSPESLSLDNLVNLDRLRNAPSQAEVATKQKAEMMQNQGKRMQVPTPAGIISGKAEPNYNDEDLFNLGLMANKR